MPPVYDHIGTKRQVEKVRTFTSFLKKLFIDNEG
jgi:hypothetical protein